MKRRWLAGVVLLFELGAALPGGSQERGNWRAASSTAKAITGDIAVANEKLTMNFSAFAIAQIRELEPAEAAAIFNGAETAGGRGNLYRLSVPADKQLLHHNTLCGADETQWMATFVERKTLQVAFFSGAKMPDLTAEALANATTLCGTYTYTR